MSLLPSRPVDGDPRSSWGPHIGRGNVCQSPSCGAGNRVSPDTNITAGKKGWLLPGHYFEKTGSHLALR